MRATRSLFKNFNFPPIPSKVELTRLSKSLATLKKNRTFLANESEANGIAYDFGPNLWKDKTVIELFPGPGVLTRSMLEEGATGIIPLEPAKIFHPTLRELEEISGVPFFFEHGEHRADDSFVAMLDDVPEPLRTKVARPFHKWDEVHPSMVFSSLSSGILESYHLSMLLVYNIYRKDGWFKYGRLPVVILAPPEILKGVVNASLVGFLWRAVADIEVSIDLDNTSFITNRVMQAIKIIPCAEPKIKAPLETFHYVASKLMVRKAQTLSSCLNAIAPGAGAIRSLLDFDLFKDCKYLTLEEIDKVTIAYIQWYQKRHGAAPIHAFF